jgi:hypothetical protein
MMQHLFMACAAALALLTGVVPGQESPRPRGTSGLLREFLEEHAELRLGPKADLAKARALAERLVGYDWSAVAVPSLVEAFAFERERGLIDGKKLPWGFEAIPSEVGRLSTPEQWGAFLDASIHKVREDASDYNLKRLTTRRRQTDALARLRGLPKVLSAVCIDLSGRIEDVAPAERERMWAALRPVWQEYEVTTPVKTTAYEILPMGLYLRFSSWIGDPKALDHLQGMVLAFCREPKGQAEPNLVEVALALKHFVTVHLGYHAEARRVDLLRQLLDHAATPESVRRVLR